MIRTTISWASFVVRHFVASIVSIAVPVILEVVVYLALLVAAILLNKGLGSPVSLPLTIALTVPIVVAYTAFFLFPSVLVAEIACRGFGKWHYVMQIPVSAVALLALVWLASLLLHLMPKYAELPLLHWASYPLYVFLILAIPLGLYWWTAKLVQMGIGVPAKLFRKLGVG